MMPINILHRKPSLSRMCNVIVGFIFPACIFSSICGNSFFKHALTREKILLDSLELHFLPLTKHTLQH
uniref:Uncharacterized protein n=1 Tax=Arundo donax TaxID=35708 RepID=A0A0A9HJN6_ARUDO